MFLLHVKSQYVLKVNYIIFCWISIFRSLNVNFDLGKSNTTGFVGRKNVRASVDADVVKYMREAGAILICLTNTSELCMWIESSNYLFGTTRNPYNLSRFRLDFFSIRIRIEIFMLTFFKNRWWKFGW